MVDGCDADGPSPYTPPLEAAGIRFAGRARSGAPLRRRPRRDHTGAPRVPRSRRARRRRSARAFRSSTWQALLGELMAAPGRIGVGVTGTHGKSTTTALLGPPAHRRRARPDRRGRRVHPAPGAHRSVRVGARRSWSRRTSSATTSSTTTPRGASSRTSRWTIPTTSPTRRRSWTRFERFVRGMGSDPALTAGCCSPRPTTRVPTELVARLGDWDGPHRALRSGWRGRRRPTWRARRAGTAFTLFDRRFEMTLAGRAQRPERDRGAGAGPRARRADLDRLAEGLRDVRRSRAAHGADRRYCGA